MPIIPCQINNKRGYKYGKTGKCYPTRNQALKQAKAIKVSQARRRKRNG